MTSDTSTMRGDDMEAARFLERDFNQCFAQMRHYDGQIWDIRKFTLTAYTVLLGVAIGLYQYSETKEFDLTPASVVILAVGTLFGLFMFSLTVRNRVYFVVVARYINEHRQLFLRDDPLGFKNTVHMYTDPSQPPFFSWLSSQTCLSIVIAILNSVLLATLMFMGLGGSERRLSATVVVFLLFLFVQVILAVYYTIFSRAEVCQRSRSGKV